METTCITSTWDGFCIGEGAGTSFIGGKRFQSLPYGSLVWVWGHLRLLLKSGSLYCSQLGSISGAVPVS